MADAVAPPKTYFISDKELLRRRDAARRVARATDSSKRHDLILDPGAPLQCAISFVEHHHTVGSDITLRYFRGVPYRWAGPCWVPVDEAHIRAWLYEFLAPAFRLKSSGDAVPFNPGRQVINDCVDALRANVILPSDLSPPFWIGASRDDAPSPFECLQCANGILHLPSRQLMDRTPALFGLNAADVDYDPEAPAPVQWLRFLHDLWGDDGESIATLQQLFGYAIAGSTKLQKIALVVGPPRSGKGTLARMLTLIIGGGNVCNPTLFGLAQRFGLATLIGKSLAIIGDARLGGQDTKIIVERLLSLSGEDGVTIERKYLPDWTGRLGTRFLVLTNELPRLSDQSGALASRFILLTLERSFLGQEDVNLFDRLQCERQGVLNWALDGWTALEAAGRFKQPASASSALQELADLASPVTAFARDECIMAPDQTVSVAELYHRWRRWCERHGSRAGSAPAFGRNLRSAFPSLKTSQPRVDGSRSRAYTGIGLLPEA
jgi:putative DNA primase/helicase